MHKHRLPVSGLLILRGILWGLVIFGLGVGPGFAHSAARHKRRQATATAQTPSNAAATDAPVVPAADATLPATNAHGGNPADPPAPGNAGPAGKKDSNLPTVLFTVHQAGGHPQEFTVRVQSTGLATYSSCNVMCKGQAPLTSGEAVSTEMVTSAGEDPYWRTVTISGKTRELIFSLARAANYFDGDFDYTKHRIADSGTKTLGYSDGERKFTTTYNWSENPAIQQLTNLFQNLSATQEGGRRLLFLRRYDKLGLEAELKALQILSHENHLAEVESITPVLQAIIADRAVMHVTRQRAQKLLDTTVTGKPAESR